MARSYESARQTRIYRWVVGTALAMISIGQFNDTKELLGSLYEDVKTHFTHQTEYAQLELLNIGRTIGYIEENFGPPEVIKQSQLDDNINFQYYNLEKAVVTIMEKQQRVVGYVVVPTHKTFAPIMPYVEDELGAQSFDANDTLEPEFFFDANNLVYFAESQDLGKQFLFLQRVWGFVEYGALKTQLDGEERSIDASIQLIQGINSLYLQERFDELSESLYAFREQHAPNFYAYTELDVNLVPEALLTRFEFTTYFEGEK